MLRQQQAVCGVEVDITVVWRVAERRVGQIDAGPCLRCIESGLAGASGGHGAGGISVRFGPRSVARASPQLRPHHLCRAIHLRYCTREFLTSYKSCPSVEYVRCTRAV
nr:hypothetical protein CFP56_28620 [Quercus suber]